MPLVAWPVLRLTSILTSYHPVSSLLFEDLRRSNTSLGIGCHQLQQLECPISKHCKDLRISLDEGKQLALIIAY